MPPVLAAIGAVVGAIGSVVATVAGAAATFAASLGAGIGASILIGEAVAGGLIIGGLALISSALKPKPPPARGSVTQINIAPDAAQPYVMGEGLVGGVLRHDTAYGATLNDVPNPYRWMAIVYSGGGPIDSITAYVDQAAISGAYYTGYLYTTSQLGAQPESAALVPQFSGTPGWNSTSKLSGQAAIGWSFKFDRNGKVFASGLPQLGAYGKWVKVYDPRLDSTFPGGSGSHRLGTESTYAWSENPALHAGMYAYGRYQNGKRTIGCGLPANAIDWANIAAWANVCDANSWRLFGVVVEPDDRWRNIKDIAAAGGGVPVISGGILRFHYQAPRTSMATITEADITDEPMNVTAMASYRNRINTISPKYRDPSSHWELVNAADVSVSSYVTADGEVKKVEWPFNFVKDVNQAAQLARYAIEDSRELQPIEISVGPHLRALRPGEAVDLNIPQLGLSTQAVILRREFDPMKLSVKLTLIGETTAKHAAALGLTGTAPPAPALAMSGSSRDDITYGADRVPKEPDATKGAPTGTPVGSITAADVSSTISSGGGVATSQVSTAAIVANAVSGINYAYTYAGTSPATSTWTTVQTVVLTTTGSSVMIKSSMNYTDVDSSSFTAKFRIRRNGTDISGEISIYPVPASDGFSTWYYANLAGSFCVADTPSAGSNTYTLEVFSTNAPNVSSRYLEVLELKK